MTNSSSPTIHALSFIVDERSRFDTDADRKELDEFILPSIQEFGLIQPIVLNKVPERDGINFLGDPIRSEYVLLAGWGRTYCMTQLGRMDIPYVLRENLTPIQSLMIEAEENIRRREMTWIEKTLQIHRIHMMNVETAAMQGKHWVQKATGDLLNCTHSHVGKAVRVAELLLSNDTEIMDCNSFVDAMKVLMKRKEDELSARMTEQVTKNVVVHETTMVSPLKTFSTEILGLGKSQVIVPSGTQMLQSAKTKLNILDWLKHEPSVLPVSNWRNKAESLHEAKADSTSGMAKLLPESIDTIFTDIPFGIEMDSLDLVTISEVEDEHDVEENLNLMLPFLYQSYRVLKPQAYLIFYMDLVHWEKLKMWGELVGFKVQPFPLIWKKLGGVKSRAAGKWWPKKMEYLMVMCKGTATLREVQDDCIFPANNEAERKKYGHPFAKPFDITNKVLSPIVRPGMVVLDPFAGTGSMLCGCTALGLYPRGFEIKKEHFDKLLGNVRQAVDQSIYSSTIELI